MVGMEATTMKRTYEVAGKWFHSRKLAENFAAYIEKTSGGIRIPVYDVTGAEEARKETEANQ